MLRSILFLSIIYLFPSIELVPTKEIDEVFYQLSPGQITYEEIEHIFTQKISHYPYARLQEEMDKI